MVTYVGWWSTCWGVLGAVGLGIAFVVWGPGEVLALLLAAVLCVAVLLTLLRPAEDSARRRAFRWSRLWSRSVVAGAATISVAACATALPYLAWPLLGLAVVTSPPVLDRVLGRRDGRPAAREGTGGPVGQVGPQPSAEEPVRALVDDLVPDPTSTPTAELSEQQVRALDTRALCHQWRHSFVALESARTAAQRMRVVAQRQLFLDELDRRSPSALAAWLASGARAAGGPERFLADGAPGQSDAA